MIGVIILNFLFAINLILRKSILDCTQPLFFQGVRLVGAGIMLLSYLYIFNRNALRLHRNDVGLFLQASLFFSYFSYALSIITLDDLSSARFAFMFNLSPFITALACYFLFKEKLNKKEILSLIIGFVGFMPLIFAGKQDGIQSASFLSIPGFLLFVSTVAYAYGWIVVKELVKRNYSPLLVTGISFFSGGIATLLTSFFFENWLKGAPVTNVFRFTGYLISVILTSEIIASNMYAALLKRYSATFLSFAGFLYPLFSAILAWLFFKEMISYNFFISAIVVGLALYIYQLSEKDKPKGTE